MTRILSLTVIALLLSFGIPFANAQIIFQDNFQSDTAGTNPTTDDLDPVIGVGDIGGVWDIRDGSTANALPLATQVLNDTVPNSQNTGTPGANNYLRIYRGGAVSTTGKPYATGWNTADTLNHVVRLDMLVWQEQLGTSVGDGVMSIMFGGTPQNNPSTATWLNTVGAWAQLENVDNGLSNPKTWAFPDNQWLAVSVIANLSSTDTQEGLLPQTYSLSIGETLVGTGDFWTTQNSVQSILVGWEGANEHFDFIDDVTIQIVPEPSAVVLGGLGTLCILLRRRR
jgi:hypothetical protein